MDIVSSRSARAVAGFAIIIATTVLLTGLGTAGAVGGPASGGWVQPAFNGAHTGYNSAEHTLVPTKVGHLKLKWHASPPQAVIAGGTYYLTAVQGKTLYAMGDRGVHLYSMKNGHAGHHYRLGSGGVTRQAPVLDGKRLIASSGANLVAVNASTGKRIWTIKEVKNGSVYHSWGSETLSGSTLYAVLAKTVTQTNTGSYSLLAINAATGHVIWSKAGFYGPITVGGGKVYAQGTVSQSAYEVAAFAAATGAPSWTYPLPLLEIASDYAYSNGSLFVGGGGSTGSQDVISLSAATGVFQWSHSDPDGGTFAESPAGRNLITDGKTLVYLSSNNHLIAVQASTGHKIWQHPATDVNAIGGGGVIYVGSNKHNHAYRLSDGKKLWSSTGLANDFNSMLAVADGRLIVAGRTTRRNQIQAFGRP